MFRFVVLVLVASLTLCAGLPTVLISQEAQRHSLFEHLDVWANVHYSSMNDLLLAGDTGIAAVVVDGVLYDSFSAGLHNMLFVHGIPVIIVNMSHDQKVTLTTTMTFGTSGESNIYGVFPFLDSNSIRHHRIIDVPDRTYIATIGSNIGMGSSQTKTVTLASDYDASARQFSEEMFACVVSGVFDPPSNMTPPTGALYSILPTTIIGVLVANLSSENKPGVQTVSHRLDNNYYNYRQNGFGEDGYYTVLMQDGIVSPGNLIISNPAQAIGFFQDTFGVTNAPYPLGKLPDGTNYYWAKSSPATVDQTVATTNSVTESVDLEIDMTVDGPSSRMSVTWTASSSTTSEIQQWGIIEDTNPITSATAWVYHQQLPYDPYKLQWQNFGQWWQIAYNNGNSVKQVPDLSIGTMQVHTISAWYASGALRQRDGTLPVYTVSSRSTEIALVSDPGFYTSHHMVEYWNVPFSDSFQMNLNYFPNATVSL